MSQFYRRQEVWIVYFFDLKLEECQQFKDQYIDMAKDLYGAIKVAAIDCVKDEELCEEFNVSKVPQIMIFSDSTSDAGEKYTGEMTADSLMKAAVKKMQNFVSPVSEDNYQSFIENEPAKHKILLFTDSKNTPSTYKALSKKFLERLNFGEVQKGPLAKKFGIESYPTIVAVTDPDNFKGETYSGEMKIDKIAKFLGNYAYSTPKKS